MIWDKLKAAFENDSEFNEKDNPGLTKKESKRGYGARKVAMSDLLNTEWNLKMALLGIAERDESTDLFAAKGKPGKVDYIS